MSLRQKILYRLSPTYRTMQKTAHSISVFEKKSDLSQAAILGKMDHVAIVLERIEDSLEGGVAKSLFSGHYEYWRAKRIVAIVEEYGEAWFKGRKILELGCGYGDIGHVFSTLGAEVIYAEGRKEHCDILRKRFPHSRVYQVNLENEWPFSIDEKFDMILHLGLLYHLKDYRFSLEKCAAHTSHLVLETEVCDAEDDFVLVIDENSESYDQSLIGSGSRPSASHIETILREAGFAFKRIQDSRCNADIHVYDWPVKNTKTWKHGLRRFWFCKEENDVH